MFSDIDDDDSCLLKSLAMHAAVRPSSPAITARVARLVATGYLVADSKFDGAFRLTVRGWAAVREPVGD